jgi:hypothetical protein
MNTIVTACVRAHGNSSRGGGAGASLGVEGGDGALCDDSPTEEVGAGEHDGPLLSEGDLAGAERVGDAHGEGGRAGDGGRGGLAEGDGGASGGGAATCPMH